MQVVNGTMEMLNEGKTRVDKEEFNAKIIALSDAIATMEDAKMTFHPYIHAKIFYALRDNCLNPDNHHHEYTRELYILI